MNITDLIVDLLRQGKQVELPGIGTFGSEPQAPHHDSEKGIFYPSSRTITFSNSTSDDQSMVELLAARECVGENVARQMWKNYMDALSDKLQRTGSHSIGNIGVLSRSADGTYTFEADDNVVLLTGDEKPLEDVKTYDHSGDNDPFAQFDASAVEAEARRRAEAQAAAEEEARRRAEEEAAEEARRAAEAQAAAEEEARRRAEEEAAEEARRAAEAQAAAEEEARRRAEEEAKAMAKAEQERLEAEKNAEAERIAALAALADAPAATASETVAPQKPIKQKDKDKQPKEGKKKNRRGWLWILLILLLLLLLCGAAYYYLRIYKPAHQQSAIPASTEHLQGIPAANGLTYNTDMLEYSQRDIDHERDVLCHYMADYLYSFLAYRNYTGAQVPMMERVRQYANDRLTTLMADRFAVQRLLPQGGDYIYQHCEGFMHNRFARKQRHVVQSELLDMKLLDSILNAMVAELGLTPDARPQARIEPAPVAPVATNAKTTPSTPAEETTRVNLEQDSRQGFDIIAGFYIDRAKAARMTARLHDLGSDAYIIEKNNMYYVSMGSAKNRTAAEALFKHIKSWYDGDIAIKQW